MAHTLDMRLYKVNIIYQCKQASTELFVLSKNAFPLSVVRILDPHVTRNGSKGKILTTLILFTTVSSLLTILLLLLASFPLLPVCNTPSPSCYSLLSLSPSHLLSCQIEKPLISCSSSCSSRFSRERQFYYSTDLARSQRMSSGSRDEVHPVLASPPPLHLSPPAMHIDRVTMRQMQPRSAKNNLCFPIL